MNKSYDIFGSQSREMDMTATEIRAEFDKVRDAAAAKGDADAVARIELAREYFTNPAFRKALEDHVWETTR